LRTTPFFLLFLLLYICFSGCNENQQSFFKIQKHKNYKVCIAIDSAFDFRLNDKLTLSSGDLYFEFNSYDTASWVYDTANRTLALCCDSLPEDDYIFRYKTVFSREQALKFSLVSDSSFFLEDQLGLQPAELLGINELKEADTIEYIHYEDGCFHHDEEKASYIKRQFKSESYAMMVQALLEKQLDLIATVKKKDRFWSTENQTFYIRAGNRYFYLYDNGVLFTQELPRNMDVAAPTAKEQDLKGISLLDYIKSIDSIKK
jgi:hypothetical protein